MTSQQIFTIGHSNLAAERLIELLHHFSITLLVDIRSQPYSRFHPQFNHKALAASLQAAVIDYRYEGQDLGGRPSDPACYAGSVLPADKKAAHLSIDYRLVQARPWYQAGVARLCQLAARQQTAILCAEEDPAHCHRQRLVAQTLLEQGWEVLHIRKDGSIQPAWVTPPSLF